MFASLDCHLRVKFNFFPWTRIFQFACRTGINVISKTASMKLQILQSHDIKMVTGATLSDEDGNTLVRDPDSMAKVQLTVSYAGVTLEPPTYCGDQCLAGKVSPPAP